MVSSGSGVATKMGGHSERELAVPNGSMELAVGGRDMLCSSALVIPARTSARLGRLV